MDFQNKEDYLPHQFISNYSENEDNNKIGNSLITCDQVCSSLIPICSKERPLSYIKQNTVAYNDINICQQHFCDYNVSLQQLTNTTHPYVNPVNPLDQNNNKQSHTYGKILNEVPVQFDETPLFFEQNNFTCSGNQQRFNSYQNLNFNPQKHSQAALATKQSLETSCCSVLDKHLHSKRQFPLHQQAIRAVSGASGSPQFLASQTNVAGKDFQNRVQQIRLATSKMNDFRKSKTPLSNLKDFQEKYSIETPLFYDKVVQYYTG